MNGIPVNQKAFKEQYRATFFYNRTFALIHWGVTISFVIVKAVMRPLVLESNSLELLQIFVLSYPNFCEAIIGSFVLVVMVKFINEQWLNKKYRISDKGTNILSLSLAAIYVITQELKIHNLGGQNVYDPFDILFSLIGLLIAYLLLMYVIPPKYGQTR